MLTGYYQIPKERIQVKTHKKYQDLSKKSRKHRKCPSIIKKSFRGREKQKDEKSSRAI